MAIILSFKSWAEKSYSWSEKHGEHQNRTLVRLQFQRLERLVCLPSCIHVLTIYRIPAYQILVHDETAIVISNGVAVSLALVLPRLHVLFKLLLIWLFNSISGAWQWLMALLRSSNRTQSHHIEMGQIRDQDLQHDLASFGERPNPDDLTRGDLARQRDERTYESRITVGASQTLKQATSPSDAALKLVNHHLAMPQLALGDTLGINRFWQTFQNMRHDPKGFTLLIALTMLFLSILIGEQAATLSSSFIVGDSMGVPQKGSCAYFRISENGNRSFDNPYWLTANKRSWNALQLVEDAHETSNSSVYARTFLKNLIYKIDENAACPFGGNTCHGGDNIALAMDTGFVDSKILGVNSESDFQWRRRMTCAPLISNTSYVRYETDQRAPYVDSRTRIRFNYTTKAMRQHLRPKTVEEMELACKGVINEKYSVRY